ncbi:hypothetical protein V6N12_001364 [Hibiscus sabdariffa]|uniref:BED-type domain-containing protein n=1 Tax=Hibiscus sabdariffa TaxID=183260 RepID=A0ABR2AVX7_9ROSI
MPPRIDKFPSEGLEGAPSKDIGWHFGDPVPNARGHVICKLCGKVTKGGITRFKEHIAHKGDEVSACPNVTGIIRESMMKLLQEAKEKKLDKRRRTDEFLTQIRGEEDGEFFDDVSAMRQATRESIQSQHEWHRREEFRRSTGGWGNVYEEGRSSSHGSVRGHRGERSIPSESEFNLRRAIPELVKSKSLRQPKVGESILKTLRKKMGEAVSKFLIYERLPFQLANSPWLYNLIQVSMEVGKGVKLPTPYEVSDVYLASEYEQVREWVNELKTQWKELGATLMCDGWTNSLNQIHIINFLVYCSKGTVFWKSVDVSSVRSRDADFYYNLLDKVIEEIGEEYIIQIVTDNEAAMKAAGKRLMLKRTHLYWTSCAAHCLDLCLEDIGKKSSVARVLEEAKKVTCFIYNHIWTVDLMKKYTNGKQILRPALTRFATHFIQLEEITRQKQGLRDMFNSKEFKESKWGQQKSGHAYETKKIVLGKDFWKKATDIIKVYEPLVKVLRLVDSDEKPTMGFIYEAIDRAKRAIKENCRYSTEYERIIDNRWNFMHSDLHSAGYFLNPQFQFGVEHSANVLSETLEGTRSVIERIEPSIDMQIRMVNQLLTFRGKHETFGTPQAQRAWSLMNPDTSYNPISLDHIFEDIDPLSEWLQEKENPLLDGENAGLFPADSSDDEINVVDQFEEQNLSDSSSSATPTQSGGDGQDSGTGGLSPIYDDDRESEFGGNMSATPSDSRERSESRARSKEKGKGTKKHTSEGSSSRRRSTSSNPGYTDSSTSTHDFYPPGSRQSSYSQPPHGYHPFPNYGMPMPYQPQMYPPPPMYQPPPPHMYPPPPMYQPPPPHMYPPVPPQLFENQGENVTFFGYIFGQRPQSQRSNQDTSQAEGEGEGGSEAYDLPRYSTNW